MLLFDDSRKLEKALGEEAAAVIAHVFERADEKWRRDLATKADLQEVRNDLIERIAKTDNSIANVRVEMQAMKSEMIKWMMGGFVAQTALLMAILAFLK
jgi:hypothetical protein